jgi:hypothetical protein
LQGRGSGRKKIEKKEKFFFSILKDWKFFLKKQAQAGPSMLGKKKFQYVRSSTNQSNPNIGIVKRGGRRKTK